MSDFKFSCPHCSQHLQINEQFSGRQVQCPKCNHLIRVPPIPGQTAQYDPQSGMTWATFVPSAKKTPEAENGAKPAPKKPEQ